MILEATLTVRYTVTDDEARRVYGTTDPAKVAAFDAEDLPGMELRLVPFGGTDAVIRAAEVRVVKPSPVPPTGSQAPSGVNGAPDVGPCPWGPPEDLGLTRDDKGRVAYAVRPWMEAEAQWLERFDRTANWVHRYKSDLIPPAPTVTPRADGGPVPAGDPPPAGAPI